MSWSFSVNAVPLSRFNEALQEAAVGAAAGLQSWDWDGAKEQREASVRQMEVAMVAARQLAGAVASGDVEIVASLNGHANPSEAPGEAPDYITVSVAQAYKHP